MNYNKDILNRFINEKVSIHVETQQEWDDFMELLESETDCKWSRVKLPTDVRDWTQNNEDTAVVLNYFGDNGLGYSPCDFYQNDGYEVIKYKDLIKGEETMTEEMKAMIELVNKALANVGESKIKEVLDFLGYKEDSKFIPKCGEKYYYIMTFGTIDFYTWTGNEYDNHSLLIGNVYRTKEEAEQAFDFQVRKAKLIKEIEDSSDAIDWIDAIQRKYYIWLDGRFNSLHIGTNYYTQTQSATYTTNKQFLEELIETRSDEVKELLFDIK